MATWLSSHDLQRAAPDATTVIRKSLPMANVEAIEDTRRIRFTISDGSIDRDNDTINPGGWDLAAYKQNPVVLWAHDARALPVAKATALGLENGALIAEAEFATHPFAQTVYELVRDGFLRATSVGFRALDYVLNTERDGVDFKRQELLEFSIVPVPANANALVSAAAAGHDLEPLREWIQTTIAEWPGELRLKGTVWDKLRGVSDDEVIDPAPPALAVARSVKRGRVLSAANEQRLRDALTALTDVLATLPQEAPSEPTDASDTAASEPAPAHHARPVPVVPPEPTRCELLDDDPVLDLLDEDLVEFDPTLFSTALGVVVRDAVRALAHDATARTLNTLRGRVD